MRPFGEVLTAIENRNGRAINFIFALEFLHNGHKLYRLSWKNKFKFIYLKNGILFSNKVCHKNQRKLNEGYPFVMRYEDIYAEDWFIFS